MLRILVFSFSLLTLAGCEKTSSLGRSETPFPIREFKVLGRAAACADTTWLISGVGVSSDTVFATTTIPPEFKTAGQIITASYLDVTPYREFYYYCEGNPQGEPFRNQIFIIEVKGFR